MNDVAELKQYIVVHARGQRIARYRELLDRIRSDEDGGPGSWVGEWSQAAGRLEASGDHLAACRHYAMARFPYVNGPARQQALDSCVQALGRWRDGHTDLEPLEVQLKQGRVRCLASGLSAANPRPLLLIMGGIVTVKEQWAPMLRNARRLGMAGLVTEMPATGENTMRYEPDSWRMLSGLLDAVSDRAEVTHTYAITLSFSGHMALRCAVDDARIKAVITVGAPVAGFFTDEAWQRGLPQITADTLAHMTGTPPADVRGGMGAWAMSADELSQLDAPVFYVASRRDEIIPASEVAMLKRHVRHLHLIENNDTHGSPRHVTQTQLWTLASLLRARGDRGALAAVLGLAMRGDRAWQRVRGRGATRADD